MVGAAKRSRGISRRRKLVFAAVATALFFLSAEVLLRLIGFEFTSRVDSMAFTFPMDDYNRDAAEPFLERDAELFWKPRPGVAGHNSLGCFGPEFTTAPANEVCRIVCLGDSCTHFGPDPYPALLQSRLNESSADRYEVINAGVIGYTSHQGLTLLRTRVAEWKPQLVTVYFGWNDHWLARDFADKDQQQRLPALVELRNALDHSRVIQLLGRAAASVSAPVRPGLRVELPDYRANLEAMLSEASAMGARLILLTAPHALDIGIPAYLHTSGEVDDPALLVALHRGFNQVVRDVAAANKLTLVDLEAEFDAAPNKIELFDEDHIHLSAIGRQLVADRLASVVLQSTAGP